MAVPTQPLPALGLSNATEDAKIRAVLLELQQILNAGIDVTNLAASFAVVTPIAVVSVLPGAPIDGQEIFYLADATNGVVWHLKYRSASASAYKWEYVGGADLSAEVATSEGTASLTYVDLTTAGPSITVPLAGDYDISHGFAGLHATNNGACYSSYTIGATAANDADLARVVQPSTNSSAQSSVSRMRRKTGISASSVIKQQYRTSTGTATFQDRWLRVLPVRVG